MLRRVGVGLLHLSTSRSLRDGRLIIDENAHDGPDAPVTNPADITVKTDLINSSATSDRSQHMPCAVRRTRAAITTSDNRVQKSPPLTTYHYHHRNG